MAEYKKIDVSALNKENIKELKLDVLVGDAVARKDRAALEFLKKQSNAKRADGRTLPITAYRMEYLEKFCGYKKQVKTTKPKIDRLFEDAFAAIEKE